MPAYPENATAGDVVKLIRFFDSTEAKTGPVFEGVSTFALYVEWCTKRAAPCEVSPRGVRLALSWLKRHVNEDRNSPLPSPSLVHFASTSAAYDSVLDPIWSDRPSPGDVVFLKIRTAVGA